MLVYYYIPKSYSKIGNMQISGIGLNIPPAKISYEDFMKHRDILVQAPWTPGYIEKVTGKPNFPYRAWITLDTIKDIPYRKLQQIASYFGADALLETRPLIYSVRRALEDL